MFQHNFDLCVKHSQVIRKWISGNRQKLTYDNKDGTTIDLIIHKDYNEIYATNCVSTELLHFIATTVHQLKTSKRNVCVIFKEPLRFDDIVQFGIPDDFITNLETTTIQFGYHTFGLRYDNHFEGGVRQREIYFTANSYDLLTEIGSRLKYCDKLKDIIGSEFHYVGIQQNAHCRFPSCVDNVILADVWTPYIILIFANVT